MPGRRGSAGREAGFTLVELLVVMGIIGILAAIAIPVITTQRGKAADAVTRQDLARLGRRVAGYYLDNTAAPVVAIAAGRFGVGSDDVGAVSPGVAVAGASATSVDTTGWTATAWCVALTNPAGDLGTFRFSAQQGLEPGACSHPNAP